MNCKPGDIAVIVKDYGHPVLAKTLGRFVRVTEIVGTSPQGRQCWAYEGERVTVKDARGTWVFEALEDDALQPIRGVTEPCEIHQAGTA